MFLRQPLIARGGIKKPVRRSVGRKFDIWQGPGVRIVVAILPRNLRRVKSDRLLSHLPSETSPLVALSSDLSMALMRVI
jgi:hypothetical protein